MSLLKRPDFDTTRLLLVDCDQRALAALQKSLERLGVKSSSVSADEGASLKGVLALVVELDTFASPALLAKAKAARLPIIVLSQHETLSQIQRGLELGATAMLNKPITQGSVYTTLMMAIGLRGMLTDRDERLAALEHKVDSRPLLAKALAFLMIELKLDETQAYERLRVLSMQLNRSVENICSDLIDGAISAHCGIGPREARP